MTAIAIVFTFFTFVLYFTFFRASIYGTVLTFIVILIVYHLIFIWLFWIEDFGWRIIEYIYLSLAIFSIIFAAYNAYHFTTSYKLKLSSYYLKSSLSFTLADVKFYRDSVICRKFIRTTHSPKNFDVMQKEHDSACKAMADIYRKTSKEKNGDLQPIVVELIELKKHITDRYLKEKINEINNRIKWHQKTFSEYAQLDKELKRFDTGVFIVLAPFLLSVALSLRVAKVTRSFFS